ncbi:hypothetical protein [Catenulispora acidiphila]|uniref:hypothetical protein n=1 Tax=Catenulispora acidiphila TaxID=304895 RepID=UPI00117E0EC9|nr:hypothetical protein [Catenulispora acidiphila]
MTTAMAGNASAATSGRTSTTVSAALGCVVVGANAKPPRPEASAIEAYTAKMTLGGAPHSTIDAGLKACFGLTPLSGTPVAQIRPNDSSRNYVNMPTPSVYWSSSYNDNVVTGNWNWTSYSGMNTQDHSDGFALGASNSIRVMSQTAGWYGNNFGEKTSNSSDGGGNLGRGFGFDNAVIIGVPNDSFAHYGFETLVFDRSGFGCANVFFTPHYSHGWSGTTLNGVSISVSSSGPVITANYSNTSEQWQAYGADSSSYNIC